MRRLRILLVEDDAEQRQLLAELLAVLGHEVCGTAATEAEAVAAALRTLPDVMLVDANLQTGNGVSAMQTVSGHATIPYIYVTGGGRLATPPDAAVLQKPYDIVKLKRALERASGQMAGAGPAAAPRAR